MICKFNLFAKKVKSKTAFILAKGQPIFSETVYLLNPIYIHKRSPAFSLVAKGKHLSGLFPIGGGAYLGDYNTQALIVFISPDGSGFDLFQTDLSPIQTKNMLLSGQLNDLLFEARKSA